VANHIKNVIKIKNLHPDDIDFILNRIATDYYDTMARENRLIIEFDKIIPEPKSESECPEDCKVNKDSHISILEDRPWFDWYRWHLKYWGTKWNAYDGYVERGKTWIRFVFSTAWTAPEPIYQKLAEILHKDMDIKYADEDLGSNCGKLYYYKDTDSWDIYTEHDLPDSYKFASRLWDRF
jgi:hypothetical protein